MKENMISVVLVEYYYTVITEVMGGGGVLTGRQTSGAGLGLLFWVSPPPWL